MSSFPANMRLSLWKYIFCLSLVFACGYANAGSIAKRQSDDNDSNILSEYVNKLIDFVRKIPLIGNRIGNILDWMVSAISLFEIGTNGALGRLLGGTFPCEITLNGTTCTGLTNNGGFAVVIMDVLDGIPSLILPGFVKSLIELFIQMFIDPTVDVLFGGVTVNS